MLATTTRRILQLQQFGDEDGRIIASLNTGSTTAAAVSTTTATTNATPTIQSLFTIEPFDNGKIQCNRWVKRLEGAFDLLIVSVYQIPKRYRIYYMLWAQKLTIL